MLSAVSPEVVEQTLGPGVEVAGLADLARHRQIGITGFYWILRL